jgi:serine phosphatase RsbU (regulator of sigma subunit)
LAPRISKQAINHNAFPASKIKAEVFHELRRNFVRNQRFLIVWTWSGDKGEDLDKIDVQLRRRILQIQF